MGCLKQNGCRKGNDHFDNLEEQHFHTTYLVLSSWQPPEEYSFPFYGWSHWDPDGCDTHMVIALRSGRAGIWARFCLALKPVFPIILLCASTRDWLVSHRLLLWIQGYFYPHASRQQLQSVFIKYFQNIFAKIIFITSSIKPQAPDVV